MFSLIPLKDKFVNNGYRRSLVLLSAVFLMGNLGGCRNSDMSASLLHTDEFISKTAITSLESSYYNDSNEDWVFGAIASTSQANLQQLLQSIGNKESYQTVVLLAPTDHKTATHNVFTYETPGVLGSKNIQFDLSTIKNLTNANIIESLGAINENSYWTAGFLDTFKRNFPESEFIFVSVNNELSSNQTQILAYGIKSYLPKNSIVFTLADFSASAEDKNPLIYEFQQDYTKEILKSSDFNHFDELPVVSSVERPRQAVVTLEVLGHYLRYKQAKKAELIASIPGHSDTYQKDAGPISTETNGYQALFQRTERTPAENPGSAKTPAQPKNENISRNTPESTVYMVTFGDIMLGRYVRHLMDANGLEYTFKNMDEDYLRVNDILLANLEGPITTRAVRTTTGMNFGFFPDTAPLLKKYHFDILSQANNHAFDKTKAAYEESFGYMRAEGIIPFGNPNEITDESVGFMHIRGHKFAFFGLEEVNTGIDDEKAVQKVKELAAKGYKVIVCPHWGIEYSHKPSKRQKELGHKLIDAGAYMIIAHHPHVVQTIENYNGHPIIYSLGNAIFDQYWSAPTQEGLSLALKMSENRVEIYLLPIKLPGSQFRLMTEAENTEFINRFITWADYTEEEKAQILAGKMTFNF